MTEIFAAIRAHGGGWDFSKPMEQQLLWNEHAAFMDALADQGFFVLVGPLEGTRDVLLIMRAASIDEISARLAEDPWTKNGFLTTIKLAPWTLRIGTLP